MLCIRFVAMYGILRYHKCC